LDFFFCHTTPVGTTGSEPQHDHDERNVFLNHSSDSSHHDKTITKIALKSTDKSDATRFCYRLERKNHLHISITFSRALFTANVALIGHLG
jgi:hypothetical protein